MLNIICFIKKNKEKYKKNYINCNLYKKNFKNIIFKIFYKYKFKNIMKINTKLKLTFINKSYIAIIKEINYHPVKSIILHIDFIFLNEEL